MKKNYKLYISIILIMVFTIFTSSKETIFASTSSIVSKYSYDDYVIDSYDIEIVVNEDNSFDITENISAYFNTSKHGIFRKLPLRNTVERLDGTTSKNSVRISDVEVINENYDTYRESGNYVIKIGSASKTLKGAKDYTIKYNYNIGKDKSENYDELYYNIIGNEWDTVIDNVTFKITMPKEFDASKLGFSAGSHGSTNSDNIVYNVVGNVITGSYNGILKAGEGVTVRLELPEGYFTKASSTTDISVYIFYGLPIVFAIAALLLWVKYGKDNVVIETVEFYPPEGYNSLEVGYLYNGEAKSQDVVSLLIYLANKGYIKIEEIEEESLFVKTKGYKITKLKEYDGNNITERIFLNGLFSSKYTRLYSRLFGHQEDINQNQVRLSDLENSFYVTLNKILRKINTKTNKHQIFEKKSLKQKTLVTIMMIVSFILISVKPLIEYGEEGMVIFGLLFPGIGFTVLTTLVFGKGPIFTKIFGLVWGSMFGGIPWAVMVLPTLIQDERYMTGYIIGFACILIMAVINAIMPKRTAYGTEILGKIKGFKNFLETVEKERLEALVMENPTYFYDILPYTYVLGVSDKWIKKFEVLAIEEPNWYSGTTAFSISSFGRSINKAMTVASTTMSSTPSSSGSGSSGGFSGGGFSGGGSGGGGGGSW